MPKAFSKEKWLADPDYPSVVWVLVDVDVTWLMGTAEKINVALPSLLIRHIDTFVAVRFGFSGRSGLLSQEVADKAARYVT